MATTYYYVKDGLLNGEPGVYAKTAGIGKQQKDGWYYLPDGYDDGIGPFLNEAEAVLEDLNESGGY